MSDGPGIAIVGGGCAMCGAPLDWEAERDRLRAALEHIRSVGGACPCGAWFMDEAERPHVIGCPVGAVFEETMPR